MRRHPAQARAARCRARSAVWLTIGALAAIPLAGCASGGSSASSASSATAGEISISTGGCGGAWHLAAPGWHTFQIHNSAADAAEVELINPANGAVYETVEALGAGTTDPMRLDVGSGSYAFRCLIEDTDAITGPTEKVPGHTSGATAILPVTDNDLYTPANEYHKYVTTGLVTLVSQVAALNKAIASGNLAAAKAAWLPAHLTYERLGAAYDSFGDFDGEIDGRADGLVGGVSSPRLDRLLPARVRPVARAERGLAGQGLRAARARRARPAGLVAEHGDRPAGHRAADPRDPGERAPVPDQRARRLRQRDHAGHHRGQHHRHPGPADRAASAAGPALHRACPRSPPGWTGCRS